MTFLQKIGVLVLAWAVLSGLAVVLWYLLVGGNRTDEDEYKEALRLRQRQEDRDRVGREDDETKHEQA